jgi:hypothetical protein
VQESWPFLSSQPLLRSSGGKSTKLIPFDLLAVLVSLLLGGGVNVCREAIFGHCVLRAGRALVCGWKALLVPCAREAKSLLAQASSQYCPNQSANWFIHGLLLLQVKS